MIEKTEVDGRPATVIYLDADMIPVTRDEATLAKVLFDDGEHVWLTLEPGTNESGSPHPA
jgi:hypothetical protein